MRNIASKGSTSPYLITCLNYRFVFSSIRNNFKERNMSKANGQSNINDKPVTFDFSN